MVEFVLLIPLGIHMARRHFQPKSWAAMQFVLEAWQEESQKANSKSVVDAITVALYWRYFYSRLVLRVPVCEGQ